MKKVILLFMTMIYLACFTSYALETLGVLPGEEIPQAVMEEAKICEERMDRQLELTKKKENGSLVGGHNLRLMSIFRKEEETVLVSTDGGKYFMGYPLPPLPVLAGALFTGMTFRRTVDGQSNGSDELSVNFEKSGLFGVTKLVKLDFYPATQTWKCKKSGGFRVASTSAYRYEDLIS